MHLEIRKIQAIDGEDFEAAKILKAEIQRLKRQLDQVDPHRPLNRHGHPSQRSLQNSNYVQASTITNTMDLSLNQREITQQAQEYLEQAQDEEYEEEDGMAEL